MGKRATIFFCFLCLFFKGSFLKASSNSLLFDSESIAEELSLSPQSDEAEKTNPPADSTTRQGTLDAARENKMGQLKSPKLSRIEKYWLNSEKDGLGSNWWGFSPKFGGFDSGAGLGGGVRFWRRDILGTPLEFQGQALFSIRGYKIYSLDFGKVMRSDIHRLMGVRGYGGLYNFRGLDKKDYNFFWYATFRYRDLPEEDFFGLGNDSVQENDTDFAQKDKTFFGTVAYRFFPWALAAGGAGYLKVEISPGNDDALPNTETVFDNTTAPGLLEDTDYFYGGGALILDLRDRPYNPHSGFFFGFAHLRYDDTEETNFSFSKTSYDLRGYLPVFADNRTLALQLYTSMNNPQDGNRVPFYMMESLGGADSLRGFDTYRFRDENLISLSTEYRWEPARFWELALFYDAGKVFPQGDDWNFNDLQQGYGIGVRVKLEKSVLLRFDVGHSDEGTSFYLKVSSPSF